MQTSDLIKLVRMFQENWGQGSSSWRVEKARQDDLGGDSGAWSIELVGGVTKPCLCPN